MKPAIMNPDFYVVGYAYKIRLRVEGPIPKIGLLSLVGGVVFLFACQGDGVQDRSVDLVACGQNSATCGDGPMFLVSKLDLVQPNAAGQVAGFDIDGIVSDGKAKDDCRVADFVSPDAEPGIDNRLSNLLANTTTQIQETVPSLIQDAIKSGGLLLVGELVGVESLVNDENVGFVIRRSKDVPLLGTDLKLLGDQTLEVDFDHYVGSTGNGKIVNGRFQAGPLEMRLRITILGRIIYATFRQVRVDLQLTERGEVSSGIIGGAFHTEDIFGVADSIEASDPNESTIPLIRAIIPPLADLRSGDSGKCDQISFGLETAAVGAFLFDKINTEKSRYRPTTGEKIFVEHGCIGCHTVSAIPDARQTVGPSLDGLGARLESRPNPKNYVTQSLVNPDGYVVSGYEPRIMPKNTRERLTSYEFDTLVAWLLTL